MRLALCAHIVLGLLGASLAAAAGFDFSDVLAPSSSHTLRFREDGIEVALHARDVAGLRGLEHRMLGETSFARYRGPFWITPGQVVEYRAVDVNGNVEGLRTFDSAEPIVRDHALADAPIGASPAPGCACRSARIGAAWFAPLGLGFAGWARRRGRR